MSLQEELIMYILRKLDIRSLCRLAHTCKLLQAHTSDPILYMNLNLQVCICKEAAQGTPKKKIKQAWSLLKMVAYLLQDIHSL